MAEGGVAVSTSDTDLNMCEVCLDDDSLRHGASWFCQQCRQRLCENCRKYHMKISTTKSHSLFPVDELPVASQQPHGGVSDEARVPLCNIHNLSVEFYCQKHNKAACITCKLMDHRQCQLQDIEHAASEYWGNGWVFYEIKKIEDYNSILIQLERIERVMENENKELTAHKDSVIETITRKMKEIEYLGQKKIVEVEEIFQNESARLNREKQALMQSVNLVRNRVKELEKVRQVGSNEEKFVVTKSAEEDLSKFQDILRDSNRLSHSEINFEVDSRLNECTSIGSVKVDTSYFMVDLNLRDTTWIDILPSQQMLRLGYIERSFTSPLGLYSADQRLLSQVDLPEYAVSAAILNDHQVIVAIPNNLLLQIVNIDDTNLTLGSVLQIDVQPNLILKYSDTSVLIIAEQNDGGWCFQILDLAGKVLKNIKLCTDILNPEFVKMSHEKNEVYVVDPHKGCFGFNMKGELIFHYTDETHSQCTEYRGLAIDEHGHIFVSLGEMEQVPTRMVKLSRTGKVLTEMQVDGTYPLYCIGNKLYMCGYSHSDGEFKEVISNFFI